jgi:hypothetical protein
MKERPAESIFEKTKLHDECHGVFISGGRARGRTADLTIKSRLLYQLSYAPDLILKKYTFECHNGQGVFP